MRDRIANGIPDEKKAWVFDAHDVLTDQWEGQTVIADQLADCDPAEWVLVEAWDES